MSSVTNNPIDHSSFEVPEPKSFPPQEITALAAKVLKKQIAPAQVQRKNLLERIFNPFGYSQISIKEHQFPLS